MTTIRLNRRAQPIELISIIGTILMTAAAVMPFAGMIAASARGLLL